MRIQTTEKKYVLEVGEQELAAIADGLWLVQYLRNLGKQPDGVWMGKQPDTNQPPSVDFLVSVMDERALQLPNYTVADLWAMLDDKLDGLDDE